MRFIAIKGCAFAALLAAAPGVAGGAASAAPKPVSWDPAPYAQYKARDYEEIPIGDFKILNAPWGKGSITAYRQCVFRESYQDEEPFGWKWDWPKVRTDDVKAYQSLSYGWNPWMKDRTNSILPARIGSVASLRVDYSAELNASGKYNLSFDVWITERPENTDPNELNVKREFMVWVDRKVAGIDQHWYAGKVRIGGEDYSFYRIPDLKGALSKRDFMIFIKVEPMIAGSLDLAGFLAYMLGKNYLTEDEYVKNIDFGNEVWYGQGETIVGRFDVALAGK